MSVIDLDPSKIEELSREELLEWLERLEPFADATDTKFHYYQPTDIARYFHQSTAKTRAMFGGNRSSKTYSHIIDLAAEFTGEAPHSLNGVIPAYRLDRRRRNRLCMDDYPNNFQKTIWPYITQLVPEDHISDYVKESGRIKAITNPMGGFLEFMQYDQEPRKFAGSSRHRVAYDEEPPYAIYKENQMRIIDTDGETSFSMTPVSGSVIWVYDKIFKKRGLEIEKDYDFVLNAEGYLADAVAGGMKIKSLPDGDPDIHVFFSCIFDNPAIPKDAAIRILKEFPKEEIIVRGKGHFMFLSGLVYKEYSDTTHLINPMRTWFSDETYQDYTLYILIDPHPRIPHAISFFVVRRDGMYFQVDEIFEHMDPKKLAAAIRNKCMGIMPEVIIMDPLGWSPDMGGRTDFATDLMDELSLVDIDCPVIKATKDLQNGIIKTKQVLQIPEGNEYPGIMFTRNCRHTRMEITSYSWDEWQSVAQREGRNEKQKPRDKDDHFMENLRRFILFDPQWKGSMKIVEKEEREGVIRVTGTGRNPVTGY